MNLCRTEMGLQVRSHGETSDREWPRRGIHQNSRESLRLLSDLGKRQKVIYAILAEHGSLTDREVLEEMGGRDMNQVRPRITELVGMGWAEEVGREDCPVTGRPVRRVRAITEQDRWHAAHQLELGIRSW